MFYLQAVEGNVKKDENQKSASGQKRKLQCDRCNRYFANHNSMNAHRFKVHRVVIRVSFFSELNCSEKRLEICMKKCTKDGRSYRLLGFL